MTRICIDAYNLSLPYGTGIATYGRSLLSTLSQSNVETQMLFAPQRDLTENSSVNESIIAELQTARKPVKSIREKWKLKKSTQMMKYGSKPTYINRSENVIWKNDFSCDEFWAFKDLYYLSHRLFNKDSNISKIIFEDDKSPNLMHWTSPMPIKAMGIPNVTTIHDIIPLKLPYTTDTNRDRYFRLIEKSIESSDHIIAVSENTKQNIIDTFNISDEKITVTYQSIDFDKYAELKKDEFHIENIQSTFNLRWKDYFLYFGAFEPKKNIGRIVEAYLASNVQAPLVLVGAPGWMSEADFSLVHQFHNDPATDSSRIRVYNFVSRDMLLALITGAKATLFPSLYEGFGLPVLESMALGTPVLASNRGALPEVVGDAGITTSPDDLRSITNGIRMLDQDGDWRAEAIQRGLTQASRFTPEKYATRLANAYSKVGIEI